MFNTADVVTSPIAMGKGKVLKVLGGIGGMGSDVAIPVTRELYNSEHNGTDYDIFNTGKEALFRLGGRGVGNAGQFLDGLSKASKDVSPALSTKLHNLDEAAHGQQRVDDRWNVFKDNIADEAVAQVEKPWHVDWFENNDRIRITRPWKSLQAQMDNGRTPVGVVIKDKKPIESFNRDDFANPEFFKVIDEMDGVKYVNNILDEDYIDMMDYLSMKDMPPGTYGTSMDGLTSKDIERIDELKSKYPEFKDKYSYKKVNSTGEGIVRGLDRLNNNGLVKYGTRVVASREPETIDIDNLKYNIKDMAKVEELYDTIPSDKKELAKQGDYSTLNEREKQIVKKYYELKALSNYNVNFNN